MNKRTLGEKLRAERLARKLSLRGFASDLGISAAYLVDIEKNRRQPSAPLLQKAADALDIPLSSFDEFSPEIPKPVKEWMDMNPIFGRILAFIKKSPSPEKALDQLEAPITHAAPRKLPIAIYESELQAMGLESSSCDTETGGDLFGVWDDIPVVYLATNAGPKAKREHAHFRLDVNYLIRLSSMLEDDWGLRYFGDWHSHHRLGLEKPSGGDQDRIRRLASKNSFAEMAEFIVTFGPEKRGSKQEIDLHPYAYLQLPSGCMNHATLIVLQGVSPVRTALMAASSLPEQRLESFTSFSLKDLRVPREPLARVPGDTGHPVEQISERALSKALTALESSSSDTPELYREAFGYIVVAAVNDHESIAFAFGKSWPHELLQVDWMDRASSRSDEVAIDTSKLSLLCTERLTTIFHDVAKSRAKEEAK